MERAMAMAMASWRLRTLWPAVMAVILGNTIAALAAGPPPARVEFAPDEPRALTLPDLIALALGSNPRLAQAGLEVEAARGRAVQAGLYPNPTLNFTGEDVGRRGGAHTLPLLSQEVVTAGKLGLGRAVAEREVEQSVLATDREARTLVTAVRQGYFDVLAAGRRIELLEQLTSLAEASEATAERLRRATQVAALDVLQFTVELDRLSADLDAARREREAAWGRLAATVGTPLPAGAILAGTLDEPLPAYDVEWVRDRILQRHPGVRSAQVGIARAQLALARAEAERVPNVTLAAGYTRNFNDREDQAQYQVVVPVPVWNRNQGNIQAARAEVGHAGEEVRRVQAELSGRLWTAFGQYAAARERAARYQSHVLPHAREAYRLTQRAFQGGQFDELRLLQAQRAVREAELEYIRLLAEAWRAASEIAGLLGEDAPPCLPGPAAGLAATRVLESSP